VLLDRRRELERQRQRELAAVQGEQQALKHQLQNMQQTVDRAKHEARQKLVGRVDLREVGEVTRYSQHVMVRGQDIVQQLAGQERAVQEARQRLMEARRQRKALERLYERQYAQWLHEARRAERRQQDELATQRYIRRGLGEGER
jgi:flagellar export protein FliJ